MSHSSRKISMNMTSQNPSPSDPVTRTNRSATGPKYDSQETQYDSQETQYDSQETQYDSQRHIRDKPRPRQTFRKTDWAVVRREFSTKQQHIPLIASTAGLERGAQTIIQQVKQALTNPMLVTLYQGVVTTS
ncbi:hypothetical protein Z517_09388 [Fonsecaea pedrosoi CBS 271.37]|uniref:Uncharacterized protein n=1 Tax=Fonsecaea pedrosoi CBS 271.37 TaxID=1442368 RepID=A0A0D2GX95_9EURO|nr:uncharacterized protein Z517_09388 [Fonsecaea pedrosoi CBS 271.37]KIW76944.1 hypothetical protein Z517_09388 [Fonsecaea pedrosoi CBS 271.37]